MDPVQMHAAADAETMKEILAALLDEDGRRLLDEAEVEQALALALAGRL